jgi:hypothetical protein
VAIMEEVRRLPARMKDTYSNASSKCSGTPD